MEKEITLHESLPIIGKGLGNLEAYIKGHFSYDPLTGIVSRDDRRNSAGSLDRDGYLILKIKGQHFKAHRIAWFLYYGTIPYMEIDHINHNRVDNRIENLRCVDRVGNIANIARHPNIDTGVVGIYIDRSTKGLKKTFTTRFNGKTHRFYNLNDAIQFRVNNGQSI